jgi:hypothetical protein
MTVLKPLPASSGRRLIPVAAVMLLVGAGCASAPPTVSPGAARAAADRATEYLVAALVASDAAALGDLISADATVRVDADVLIGNRSLALLAQDAAAALTGVDVGMIPQGHNDCTGAVHQYGEFTLQRYEPADSAFAYAGRYSLLWDVSDVERPMLRHAGFHEAGRSRQHRVPVCRTVTDSTFQGRRIWVSVHPVASKSGWHDGFVSALGESGWVEARGQGGYLRESSARLRPSLVVQSGVRGRFIAGATVNGMAGGILATSPTGEMRRLTYSGGQVGSHAGIALPLPVITTGRFSAAAGPTFLRLNGVWGSAPFHPVAPVEHDEEWSAWALGLVGDIGLVIPFGSRMGVTARMQQAHYPPAAIPGHRGSDPFRVAFGHRNFLIGAGAKLW